MKVQKIEFRMELSGTGVVNFDEYTNEKGKLCGCYDGNTNHKIAKSVYTRDENGNISRTLKISAQCIRNNIFKDDVKFISASVSNNEEIMKHYVSTPYYLLKGEFLAGKKYTLNKTSALTIVDAIETENTPIIHEFQCNSVNKDDDKSGNKIINIDSVGEVKYKTHGFINLLELQFLSADPVFGRVAILEEWLGDVKRNIDNVYGEGSSTIGEYSSATATLGDKLVDKVKLSEFGLYLNDNVINVLVKILIKKMLGISIERAQAEAHITKLEIRFIRNLEDKNKTDNWVNVTPNNYELVIDDGMSDGVFEYYKKVK